MISYYVKPVWHRRPRWECTLEQIASYIRTGRARNATETLRTIENPDERRAYKKENFDFVTFSGNFTRRVWDKINYHTGLMSFDLDHLGTEAQVRAVKERLKNDQTLHPRLIFASPSGDGVKLVTQVSEPRQGTPEELSQWHKMEYSRQMETIRRRHNLECDTTSDVTRTCYLSWDPEVWIYQKNRAYTPSTEQKIEYATRRIEARQRDVTAEYRDWVRLGFGLASEMGESGRDYYHRISRYYPGYTRKETDAKYDECLANKNGSIRLGTILWLLRER